MHEKKDTCDSLKYQSLKGMYLGQTLCLLVTFYHHTADTPPLVIRCPGWMLMPEMLSTKLVMHGSSATPHRDLVSIPQNRELRLSVQ